MTIKDLKIGESAIVTTVGGEGALRQHFLDMGVIPGTLVSVTRFAPMGDPVELMIQGYTLTMRLEDAAHIEVCEDREACRHIEHIGDSTKIHKTSKLEHPGFGEHGARFHSKKDENPLPDDTLLTYALVGNQNCGKTTLFNQLTGANQHVGNFPGVTVDRKDGPIKGNKNTLVTDLPGIYSMSPYTSEEIVSRNFVLNDKPKAIINIVDATNIHRNLYLTMQLLELGIPMVVAINMMDELTGNGGTINVNEMESMLGVPVVPISAAKNQGIEELINHAMHIAHYQEAPLRQDFCDVADHDGAIHRCIHAVIHLIEDHARRADLPVRFAATKVIEGDQPILDSLNLDQNELEMLEHIILQMEKERGLDRSAAMADMRFSYINRVCEATVVAPRETREHKNSERIDKILTGRFTAIPAFIVIMALTFILTFNVIGAFFQDMLESGIEMATEYVDGLLLAFNVNETLHSLIIDGIFSGVGSVLSFLPIVVTLFFFLSLLEDSGYIARVAFFMDKLLRKIGLSGRSIVPLLIGFGCTVPAVMSTRTLPSARDRKMTILLTPFMSCTAKLPIYAFFVNAFFSEYKGLIMTGLYFVGIIVGILVACLFKLTIFKGEAVPFVMELPNYRFPSAKTTLFLLWEKAKDFIQKAFSVILIATICVWFLQSFDIRLNRVIDSKDSIMAIVAGIFAPIFKPLGMGDWRIVTSLISGVMAKESVVSTMDILFGSTINTVLSHASAFAMLIFCLLYTPCIAAIASVKRELGSKWAAILVVWQCAVAWIISYVCYVIVNIMI